MASVSSAFERDLKALKLEFEKEREELLNSQTRTVREMKGVIAAVELEETLRIEEAKTRHHTKLQSLRNKNLEVVNDLRHALDNKINDLEKAFEDAHRFYKESTDGANQQFRILEREDKRLSALIGKKQEKIDKYNKILAQWKKKIALNAAECSDRNKLLQQQKDKIAGHCNELKARMKRFRGSQQKHLTELTVLAREALQDNTEKLKQGERLIALAELARKLETEREKVQPFYESTKLAQTEEKKEEGPESEQLTADEIAAQAHVQEEMSALKSAAIDESGQPVDQWGYLQNFHKKFNKVLLDKVAIGAEKKRLQKENADLRAILKQYLDGIAITADVVDSDNPLLIVNGRVSLANTSGGQQVKRAPNRPAATLEASQVVQNYAAHRR